MMRVFLLVALIVGASADCYLHMPRGSNNRLNEASAERNNGDRLMDTQNNNRGGYNVGDKSATDAAPANNPVQPPATNFDFNSLNTPMQYGLGYFEGSTVQFEWTNQHGCGGNEASDPYKLNCNLVFQYMCNTPPLTPDQPLSDIAVTLKDGGNTNTPDEPNSFSDITATAANNDNNQRGRHESETFYYNCKRRQRNYGLFHADQNLNGYTSRFTRQNNNGNRRGLECPEERDYYPWWNPSPWRDIGVLTDHPEFCPMYAAGSQNNNDVGFCHGLLQTATDQYQNTIPITQEDCVARGAPAVWMTHNKGLPPPDCTTVEWSRVNHLGNGRSGEHLHYQWTIPTFSELVASGLKTDTTGNFLTCIVRIRYNISTDDYNPWTANSTMDDREDLGILSPIRQNPTVDIGAHDLTGLRLALNTNQFGRTFQDRSHVFYIMKRPATGIGAGPIFNLQVRGKRGNIVQTYPSVEYDFTPNKLSLPVGTLLHVMWTGSNTHNNGNPAGDGQAGDAGEGNEGTDRHNFVQMGALNENYPLPLDQYATDPTVSLWANSDCYTHTGVQLTWQDCSLIMATSGQYRNMNQVSTSATNFDPLLNDAPPSLVGGMVFKFKSSAVGMTFNYMCTRNNNFSNRSQKGTLTITS